MEVIEPVGEFPPKLLRGFSEEANARAFVERGHLRFRPVSYFAALEDDVRADPTEGRAHLRIAGTVTSIHLHPDGNTARVSDDRGYINFQSQFVNPVFVYCFSYPPDGNLDLLPVKFGRFVVQVDEPRRLAHDVAEQMARDRYLGDNPWMECHKVQYTKGNTSEDVADHFRRATLTYTQKPPSFADEFEYRFAAVDARRVSNRVPSDEFYDVVLGHSLSYASISIRN